MADGADTKPTPTPVSPPPPPGGGRDTSNVSANKSDQPVIFDPHDEVLKTLAKVVGFGTPEYWELAGKAESAAKLTPRDNLGGILRGPPKDFLSWLQGVRPEKPETPKDQAEAILNAMRTKEADPELWQRIQSTAMRRFTGANRPEEQQAAYDRLFTGAGNEIPGIIGAERDKLKESRLVEAGKAFRDAYSAAVLTPAALARDTAKNNGQVTLEADLANLHKGLYDQYKDLAAQYQTHVGAKLDAGLPIAQILAGEADKFLQSKWPAIRDTAGTGGAVMQGQVGNLHDAVSDLIDTRASTAQWAANRVAEVKRQLLDSYNQLRSESEYQTKYDPKGVDELQYAANRFHAQIAGLEKQYSESARTIDPDTFLSTVALPRFTAATSATPSGASITGQTTLGGATAGFVQSVGQTSAQRQADAIANRQKAVQDKAAAAAAKAAQDQAADVLEAKGRPELAAAKAAGKEQEHRGLAIAQAFRNMPGDLEAKARQIAQANPTMDAQTIIDQVSKPFHQAQTQAQQGFLDTAHQVDPTVTWNRAAAQQAAQTLGFKLPEGQTTVTTGDVLGRLNPNINKDLGARLYPGREPFKPMSLDELTTMLSGGNPNAAGHIKNILQSPFQEQGVEDTSKILFNSPDEVRQAASRTAGALAPAFGMFAKSFSAPAAPETGAPKAQADEEAEARRRQVKTSLVM